MPEEAAKEARRELDRLAKLPTAAAEYGVIRTYLDWLVNLPWNVATEDNLDIAHAAQVLDEDHYGLKDIKERILEYPGGAQAAPGARRASCEASHDGRRTYCAASAKARSCASWGRPAWARPRWAQSIARAMGRKFIRMSLGGVRDEAEIRGFRRTYIGAMPGRIIQALRRVETAATRCSCWTRSTSWGATSAAIRPRRCWKCWTRSRTASSAIIIWMCRSTCRR